MSMFDIVDTFSLILHFEDNEETLERLVQKLGKVNKQVEKS